MKRLFVYLFFLLLSELMLLSCEEYDYEAIHDFPDVINPEFIDIYENDSSTVKYNEIVPRSTIYLEDFNNPQNSVWKAFSNEDATVRIENGLMYFTSYSGSYIWVPFDLESYKDFQIEASIQSNATDSENGFSGMLFNIKPDNTRPYYYFSLINRAEPRLFPDLFIGYIGNNSVRDMYHKAIYANKQDFHLYTIRKTGKEILLFFDKQYKFSIDMDLQHNYGFVANSNETLAIDYIKINDITQDVPVDENPVELGISILSKTYKSITVRGSIGAENGNKINERGIVCSSTATEPTIMDIRVPTTTTSSRWDVTINMLSPGTKYYVRSYVLCNNSTSVSYSEVTAITTDQLPNKAGLQITEIDLSNVNSSGQLISNWGANLYSNGMRYLYIRIKYNSLSINLQSVTLYVKIVNPDGSIRTIANAPAGFSFEKSFSVEGNYAEGAENILGGVGNATQSVFPAGTYKIEVWDNKGTFLSEKTFTIR